MQSFRHLCDGLLLCMLMVAIGGQTTCQPGFFKEGVACQAYGCDPPCASCAEQAARTSPSTCVTCMPGSYLEGSSCKDMRGSWATSDSAACGVLQNLALPPYSAECKSCYRFAACIGLAQRKSDGYPVLPTVPDAHNIHASPWQESHPCGCLEMGRSPKETCTDMAEVFQSQCSIDEAVDCMQTCFGFKEESFGSHQVSTGGMFAYHKEIFPLDFHDIAFFLLSSVGIIIAAGGGIGGGGILVPLCMILLRFRPKHSIALSNLTIFGGSIANVVFNLPKRQANGKSMIDWDIIVIMEPSTIAGAVIGSFLSKYLPDFVLTVCLCIVLGMLSYRTLGKGIEDYRKENEALKKAPSAAFDDQPNIVASPSVAYSAVPSGNHTMQSDGPQMLDPPRLPWAKVNGLIYCFAGCIVLTVLKGSGHGSIIGVECGSVMFWFLSMANVPWVVLFGWHFRKVLMRENEERKKGLSTLSAGEIEWNNETTIKYPIICTAAGIFAGLFGVGGGIVKGPLMLEMGVPSQVAAATAATMIFFTTSAACVSFVLFGLLEPGYGVAGFCMGLGCTALGQHYVNRWMAATKRQSPPKLSMGMVMALSTVLVAIEAFMKFAHAGATGTLHELLVPTSICATAT